MLNVKQGRILPEHSSGVRPGMPQLPEERVSVSVNMRNSDHL